MQHYANKGGNSGVVAYETTVDSITVKFRDGWYYLYNDVKPGMYMVEHMQSLAHSGQGLNSYISSTVKNNFARKYR
jgi:hypothetical protein